MRRENLMSRRTSEIYRFVCYVLHVEETYTMKAIAELLKISPNAVSTAIRDISHRVWVSNQPNDHHVYDVSYELKKARKYIEDKNMKSRLKMNARR